MPRVWLPVYWQFTCTGTMYRSDTGVTNYSAKYWANPERRDIVHYLTGTFKNHHKQISLTTFKDRGIFPWSTSK